MIKLKTKLRKYQREGVHLINGFNGRALIADEMGTGKSYTSLAWMVENECYPAIVVCPAFLKVNWERECLKHLGMRSNVLEGREPKERGLEPLQGKITIINYDILRGWTKKLLRMRAQLLIVDECQYCKSLSAKRTKAVRQLSKHIPNRLYLSGTPLTNRPPELFSVLNMIKPKKYHHFRTFAQKYAYWNWNGYGLVYAGPRNLKRLHRTLKKECLIRRLKKDVLKDLPEKSRYVVPLQLKDRREYDYAEKHFLAWLRSISKGKARKASYAVGLTRLGYLKRLAAQLKMDSVKDWIETFLEESNNKLAIFGVHRSILGRLHERFKTQSVLVTGKTPKGRRWKCVDQFQEDKRTRLFLGNYQAAGIGLNLTSASTGASIELPWTPAEATQAEDRLHRLGQKKQVDWYYLVAQHTIEDDLCKLLQEKQKTFTDVLDGKDRGDSLEIYNELVNIIGRRVK
jgi:SWI/SNF-related matrix-associated actin-dependent regulator of chromatin subfamily A-like protein 1